MTVLDTVIGIVIVPFLIALFAILVFEVLRTPHFEVFLPESETVRYALYEGHRELNYLPAKFCKLSITNKPLLTRPWLSRFTAFNAKCLVTIADKETRAVVNDISNIACKWDAREEPSSAGIPFFNPQNNQLQFAANPSHFVYLVQQANFLDLHSKSEPENVAIVMKIQGDSECYLFSGESYESPRQWRRQDRMIPQGEFVMLVQISSENAKSSVYEFSISNNGTTRDGFRIEQVKTSKKPLVKRI